MRAGKTPISLNYNVAGVSEYLFGFSGSRDEAANKRQFRIPQLEHDLRGVAVSFSHAPCSRSHDCGNSGRAINMNVFRSCYLSPTTDIPVPIRLSLIYCGQSNIGLTVAVGRQNYQEHAIHCSVAIKRILRILGPDIVIIKLNTLRFTVVLLS